MPKHVTVGSLVFNVLDYGAKGDGTTDDTTAIQAAIDAATATTGMGIVFLPRGNFTVSTLTMKPFVTIRGAGRYRTTITARPGASAAMIQFPSGMVQNVYIEDVQLAPGTTPNVGQHGVYAYAQAAAGQSGGWWYGGMRRVRIAKFDGHGLWLRGGGIDYLKPHQFLTFEGVESFAGTNTTSRSVLITGQVGQALFSACELDGNGQGVAGAGTSIEIKREVDNAGANLSDASGYTIDFLNCTIQANALGARVERAANVKFDNCWFEDLNSGVLFETSVEMGIVTGCSFADAGTNGSSTGYLIQAGATSTVVADGNRFAGSYDRDLVANSSNGVVISRGNRTSKTNMVTAGMTKQLSTATIAIDNNQTALISSGPALQTINSKHTPGELIHLRAWTADFTLVSGGNINLAGMTSPVMVRTGQIVTLVRTDLGTNGWILAAMSPMDNPEVKSPNGTRYRIGVNDSGALTTTSL